MSKWIAEFDLEDGDTMPEHMDLEYRGTRIDFHCKPLEQEPFINKPCVSSGVCEHDKQKVLDKIREQIKSNLRGVEIALEVLVENHPLRPKMEGAKDTLEDCLELIDKAETEET